MTRTPLAGFMVLGVALVAGAGAQETVPPWAGACGPVETSGNPASVSPLRRPKVEPYAMTMTETTEQTFANGLTIKRIRTSRTMQNSAGWTRMEHEEDFGSHEMMTDGRIVGGAAQKFTSVTVLNLPGHLFANWSLGDGQPHRANVASTIGSANEAAPRTPARKPAEHGPVAQRTREDLGTRTIQGIVAKGTRLTIDYPPDYNGNTIAYHETEETWVAAGTLPRVIERTMDSPKGRTKVELVSYTAGEPDESLFRPPADYSIVCQKTVIEKPTEAGATPAP